MCAFYSHLKFTRPSDMLHDIFIAYQEGMRGLDSSYVTLLGIQSHCIAPPPPHSAIGGDVIIQH